MPIGIAAVIPSDEALASEVPSNKPVRFRDSEIVAGASSNIGRSRRGRSRSDTRWFGRRTPAQSDGRYQQLGAAMTREPGNGLCQEVWMGTMNVVARHES